MWEAAGFSSSPGASCHVTLLEVMYWAEGVAGERPFHSCIPFPQGNAAQAGESPF